MKIAFDLDGTVITQGSPGADYKDSLPIESMRDYVNSLYGAGHEIYFYTARHFKHHIYTDGFLRQHGYKFHGLYMNKISVDIFVDDRAVRWDLAKQEESIKNLNLLLAEK